MHEPQTGAASTSRVLRWRYQTAVQAARMLNAMASPPRTDRHPHDPGRRPPGPDVPGRRPHGQAPGRSA